MADVKPKPRTRTTKKDSGTSSKSKSPSTTVSGTRKRPTTTAARGGTKAGTKAPAKPRPGTTAAKKSGPAPKVAGKKAPAPRGKMVKDVIVPEDENKPKREMTEHGFIVGTDSATIADRLVAGGTDRADVNTQIIEAIENTTGLTNRNGTQKYIPSMVSGILGRMLATGKYEIHASWQLVPIAAEPAKKVTRARKK